MSPRRAFYTRLQVMRYFHVTMRTVIRWEGVHLTKLRDPNDPTGRGVIYEGTEVESWARLRARRGSGTYRIGDVSDEESGVAAAPVQPRNQSAKPGKTRAALDRRIAARAREEREEREQSSRDDETAKESKGSSRPQVAPDDELERWNRQIDERKRRWEAEHPKGEESEIEPPASAKKK